ncbi:TIGR03862 family flavoprotein [Pseudomonas sp. gcc21]|uniref:TIGR03862 family flavoprotein n=1 Tax=Pseudomonas sp. gcc21 TaxID=2726989 RepID=UPI0014528B83|nr:TIGR03862 family flavoprotein [Pseudomonas sp. gcc21]QJD60633.1 TIGR03862 family flavoprotein [Pseudomonas sp. gcc21]
MRSQSNPAPPSVAIIGGGPAGLMAAETLANSGAAVTVYDAMPSVGRKFLLAGVGGMNITHSEPAEAFIARYREASPWVADWLASFDADALRVWIHGLGIDTFVGSSGRVFPVEMKAAPLLRAWLRRLRESGVTIQTRHRWVGWNAQGELEFATPAGPLSVNPDAVVLALGGGSWARLGSDGAWTSVLSDRGVAIRALIPANCGFTANWSAHLKQRFAGTPLKQVIASVHSPDQGLIERRGECVVTEAGLEGSLIYALSAELRDQLSANGEANLTLDLAPDRSLASLISALEQPRKGQTLSSVLRKRAGLDPVKIALLHECLPREAIAEPARLASGIKKLPVRLTGTSPLDEAISSAGGVCRDALDDQLMLRQLPGVFCAGEMLDWEAPTGGYLLTGCFASGRHAAHGVMNWLALSA